MTDKQFSFGDTSTAFSDRSANELRKMNFLFTLMGVPELTKLGIFFIKTLLKLNFPIKKIVKATIFKQFCGGETLEECQVIINKLGKRGIKSIPDYSVEGESEEKNYAENTEIIRQTIVLGGKQKAIGFAVFKITSLGSTALLEKIQKAEPLDERASMAFERINYRIHSLCETAYLSDVRILIDAEESWIQTVIDNLALQMMRKFNKQKAIVYNTYQLYKTASLSNLRSLNELALLEEWKPAVKLVRGAYMEQERQRAKLLLYDSPIHKNKEATDEAFNNALEYCIKNKISLCAGSHNEDSNLLLTALMKTHSIPNYSEAVYFAQLYGMSDHISFNLAKAGYNVAKYLPFGPVRSVMPYLFRRAEENKSVTGQMSRELKLIREEIRRRKLI
ncbi:MAG TPA: proline dehydrogenase family protein [Cytophagaceae bacterium]|jgi:proline dehydrogenase|nr:proline dehydrogenase family protein [Cytophagaceae bacterium]